MALYTETYLRNLTQTRAQLRGTTSQALFESIRERSVRSTDTFDIFLSHSYMDKPVITGLHLELTNMGFTVYVDWMIDRGLDRERVDKATAQKIRTRMKQSKSLSYAASENAAHSKWMPWELGYKDGENEKCSILPVSKESSRESEFPRQEYLGLYPYLTKDQQYSGRLQLRVNHDNGTTQAFDDWLRP